VDEIEREGWKGQRREVPSDGRSRPWTWRKRLERWSRANANEGKGPARAIDEVIFDLDERPQGRPRKDRGSERRDRRIDVSAR
jgi:hypothetical protein